MSRTGNLLFPDNKDDGWVTSIIKALPEEKPKDDAPVTDDIEDPVAIEAEAAFAETAADTTVRDAIETAAWIPQSLGPDGELSPAAMAALEKKFFLQLCLDGVPDLRFQVDAVEAVDLLKAGGRRDIDLGEIAADDVDADENQSARL